MDQPVKELPLHRVGHFVIQLRADGSGFGVDYEPPLGVPFEVTRDVIVSCCPEHQQIRVTGARCAGRSRAIVEVSTFGTCPSDCAYVAREEG